MSKVTYKRIYNKNNQLLKELSMDNQIMKLCEYDDNNLLIYQSLNNITTKFKYDENNRLIDKIKTNYFNNCKSIFNHSYENNLLSKIKITYLDAYDQINRPSAYILYEYDKNNNLIKETINDNVTLYEYNEKNQLISKEDEDIDMTFEYDDKNNIIKEIYYDLEVGEHIITTFLYDEYNNLILSKEECSDNPNKFYEITYINEYDHDLDHYLDIYENDINLDI